MTALNPDQQRVADEIFSFLLDPNQKEMSISGPAGVGKTYLLQYLFNRIMPMYIDACKMLGLKESIEKMVFTATTNRAADVLTSTIGQSAQTIHSFMNLKVYDDMSSGRQRITKSKNFTVHMNTLIVIDEASMVDRELKKILEDGTNSSCKIIYVGDHCQMAPVGEKLSLVWGSHIPRSNLTIPMRNSGQPALMALCDQMRATVQTGLFYPIYLVPGVIEQLDGPQMENHVNRVFMDIENDSRIMTYTNNEAKSYNEYIRAIRGNFARFDTGEMVVNNSGIDLKGQGTLCAEMEFSVKRDTALSDETLDVDGMQLVTYKLQLTSLKNNTVYQVYQADDPVYYQKILAYFRSHKDWPNYFRLKNMIPDLRSRDASTVYKAQGSSFNSVYIDLQDIGKSNIADQVARMLYVAVSRPRNRIYFYGRLPDKYLGG
jgi:exodeoxyribonuclease-5